MIKYLLIVGLVGIMLLGLVGATYTAPSYTNVTIVLYGGYTAPSYTNVTIVLDPSRSTNCWSKTGNVIYIPSGCVYSLNSGVSG